MNCEYEFGTFYKIKLLYQNLKFNVEKQLEYHLSKKNNCYIYCKFIINSITLFSSVKFLYVSLVPLLLATL